MSACVPSTAAPSAWPPTESPLSATPAAAPTITQAPRTTRTPVQTAGPTFARDAALAYLAAHYGDMAPAAGLQWMEENITEEGVVGSSTFRYAAGDWTITVSCPIVAPDQTIYTLVAANELTGFNWEGQIRPSGEVAGEVPEGPTAEIRHLYFGGVSFSYDGSLADDVLAESVPESELPMPGTGTIPEHFETAFDRYALPETFHEARIYVYPVAQLQAGWKPAGAIVASLQQALTNRPSEPEGIVTLPPMNAGQLIRARTGYLDFRNGSGVRFLTMLGQAYLPVNNFELFYTFQGLTDDGRYYVSAILPVAHPSLPEDGSQIPGGDPDAFAQQFESYAAQVEAELNAQDPLSFTPALLLLDAMIQSMAIEGMR